MIRRPLPIGRAGFSLLEVLVAVGLFSIFTLTLTRLMLGGMDTYKRGQVISSLRADLRGALDLISADFRQSTNDNTSLFYNDWGSNQQTVLTFKRNVAQSGGGATEQAITYTIDSGNSILTRRQGSQTVLVAENILVGPRLGETPTSGQFRSYFRWAVNPNLVADKDFKYFTMEVRLTGARYSGAQEQRLSMVTWISQRAGIEMDPSQPRITGIAIPLSGPIDLGRPVRNPAWKPASEGLW